MKYSLHQTKRTSDFPQFLKYSPLQNKKIIEHVGMTQSMQRKNPLKNEFLSQSQSNLNMTKSLIYNSLRSDNSTKINKPNHTNILQGSKISQKLLRKSKKYYRVDAKIKQNQNIIQKDIQNLIQTLSQKRQKNDIIIINLRDKFQTHKKQLKKKLNLEMKNLQRKIFIHKQKNHCQNNQRNKLQSIKKHNQIENKKYLTQQQMKENYSEFFNKSMIFNLQVKNFKNQLKTYINNFKSEIDSKQNRLSNERKFHKTLKNERNEQILQHHNTKITNGYFKEYLYLAQKSYDSLQMLLKCTLVTSSVNQKNQLPKINYTRQQIQNTLKKIDKKLTLSVFKSTYKCLQLQYNSKQIINKILLALGINPLNEFFFVRQQTFTLFKKLLTNQASQRQSKQFLLAYFCLDHQRVKKQHFQSSVHNILKKLTLHLNEKTVQNMFQKWKNIMNHLIKLQMEHSKKSQSLNDANNEKQKNKDNKQQCQYYSKRQIKSVLGNDTQFLWDEILRLIFLV